MLATILNFAVAYHPPMTSTGLWRVEQDVVGRWCVVRTEGWYCMVCLTGPLHIEDDRPEERARSLAQALNRAYANS